jgi:hypothetical protein
MVQEQQIAEFLRAHGFAPPANSAASWMRLPGSAPLAWRYQYPPTVQELAQELVQIAEFRALRLGTWLGTADGLVITKAVEVVVPPFLRPDIELLTEGLKLAARLQQEEGQRVAGRVVLAATSITIIGALLRWGSKPS